MWTKEEIIEKLKDKYDDEDFSWASDFLCEDGTKFSYYKDDDEFYTDGDKFYPKNYAESLYEHELGLKYIEDRDLRGDLQEYCEQDFLDFLLLGYDYPQEKFKELVKDFVFEDYDDFMDFYMEGNYDKDTGNDSALN